MLYRIASAAAIAASLSMAAAPLAAADLPLTAAPAAMETAGVFDAEAVNAQGHRRWYRRDRVDAGDVIGGLLVLGTIAAVASAASKASQRNRYPDRDYRTRGYPYPYPDRDYDYDRDYRSRPYNSRIDESRGIDRAVDMCAAEVERNARIDTVDSVNRTGQGWTVGGRLRTGEPFTCSIGADGRIDAVDYGRRGAQVEDRQWDDDRYAAARAAQDAAGTPGYPGGPLPGDETAATGENGSDETTRVSDFPG
jgi:hypothetical protein